MPIRIVTDTATNLPRAIIDEFQIMIVSGTISFGAETFLEYPDLKIDDFYRRLIASKTPPVGRDPNVLDFKKEYTRLLGEQPDTTILSIHVSEALGTAISAARQAAALLPMANIRLFDSRNVSLGQGLMVWEAARMAKAGARVEEILQRLAMMRERTELFVLVDTLEYLAKGGRVGPVARLVGGLLNVKPILTLKDGLVQSHSQYRTRARGMAELKQFALAKCEGVDGLRMGIMHALCEDDARQLADEFQKKLQPELLTISDIGPAVGANTGPGAIGVAWFAPPKAGSPRKMPEV